MNKDFESGLSNQEIIQISNQTNIRFSRYYFKTKTVESLFEDPETAYGISYLQDNMPDHIIDSGIISPDTVDVYRGIYDAMDRCEPNGCGDIKIKNDDGIYHWHHADFSMVYDENGEPTYALITFLDNNPQREMEISAEKWRTGLSALVSNSFLSAEINLSKNSIIQINENQGIIGKKTTIVNLNDFVPFGILGEFKSNALIEYNNFFDLNRLLGLFEAGVTEDHYDYYIKNDKNKPLWLRASVSMTKHNHSEDITAMVSFTKLENLQKDFDLLTQKVLQDSLTGILNREGIEERVKSIFSDYNPNLISAIFVIDVDDFKSINDKLGHQTGDAVLKIVANILQNSFRDNDIVGRIGGDEFVVSISGKFSLKFLEKKAFEVLSKVVFELNSKYGISNSISIGIAYGQGKFTFDKLYRIGDISLYTAKRNGKNRFHIINADTNEDENFYEVENDENIISLEALEYFTSNNIDNEIKTPYKVLLDNIPGEVIVISINDTITITHCNDWITSYTGFTIEELENEQKERPFFFIHSDDLEIVRKTINELRSGKNEASIGYRVLCKNGEYRNMVLNLVMTERNQDGSIFYGINSGADETSSIEEQLIQSRKQLDTLINAIPGGVAMLQLSNKDELEITHFNNWIYDFTGFSKEEYEKFREGYQLKSFATEDIPILKKSIENVRNALQDSFHIVVKITTSLGEYKPVIIHASLSSRTDEKTTMYVAFLDHALFN